MSGFLHTIAGKIAAALAGVLLLFSGAAHTATNTQPIAQMAAAVVATQEVGQTSSAIISTASTGSTSSPQATVVNNYITQPVIERTVVAPTANGYVTQSAFQSAVDALTEKFGKIIYGTTYPAPATTYGSGGVFNSIALSNKIDSLSGTHLSSITVSGVSGLTASDIPALSYLSSVGGTVSGLSSFSNASTSLFSVFNNAYFGGTATSSFDSTGALTLATPLALTSGGTGWSAIKSGYITFGNGSSAIATSSALFWDNTNSRLGIGTTSPLGRLSVTGAGTDSGTTFLLANSLNTPTFTVFNNGTVSFAPSVTGTSGGNTAVQNLVAATPSGTVTGTYTGFRTSMGYNSASDTSGGVTGIQGVGRLYNGAAGQTQGIYGIAEYDGTGTNSGSLYGGRFQSQITSTGVVTHAIGIKIEGPSIATGGTATNAYGLYVQGMTTGNSGTIGGSAAVEIEGIGSGNAIAFSGNGGSGINSKIYSSSANQLNIEASSNLLLNTLGGNLGVGTTTPWAKVSIAGTAGATIPVFTISTSTSAFATSTAFLIDKNGNVGIGTASPGVSTALNVNGMGLFTGGSANPLDGTAAGVEVGYNTTGDYGFIQAVQTGVAFKNLILQPTTFGRVGVGTTSPGTTFDVRGSSAALSSSASGIGFIGTGMSKLQIGYDTSTTHGYAWLAATKDSGTWSDVVFNPTGTGRVGVASTTPWKTFSVTGTVAFDGLTSDTADSKVLCLTSTNEVVANAGTSCITSSQRFKNTIEPLATSSGLAEVLQLNPVSFQYNSDIGITGTQVGFIAEQVQRVDPRLVVLDASSTPFTVRYEQLTSILAKAIQEIGTISGAFRDNLVAWLGDAGNGVHQFFADIGNFHTVNTDNLCVKKSDGSSICVTGDQLASAVAGGVSTNSSASGGPSGSVDVSSTSTTPPVIEVIGNNPATVNVGDTYSDLGAKITGPTADLNLGIHTFVGTTPIEFAAIDTSVPATYHLYYVATDQNGLTATSTRTVIVQTAATTNSDTVSTTTADASSTSQ